jgi:acetyltransferase
MNKKIENLNNLFYAKNIALFGASNKKGSVGYQIASNLKTYKQSKKLYFINPRLAKEGKKLFNKKVYSTIKEINSNIDLAIIAIPAKFVLDCVHDLVNNKCKNIVLITAGFNEIGDNKRTQELKYLISKYNINLIGPNCLGILNLDNNLNATFNSNKLINPKFGNISIISQSGALATAMLDKASQDNLNISKFVSYGNAIDINECDLIEYLCNDKKTDVILVYIEGVTNGRRLFNLLKKYSSKKKIIILKGGISKKGSTAAKSHTAAIAGSKKVFSSAIKQAGAYLVDSVEDLFYLGKLFSIYKNLNIKNTQIITNGGGFGVLSVDQISKTKLKLAKLSKNSKKEIKKIVPRYAVIKNPLDLTGDANVDRFKKIINICLNDPKIDSISLLVLFQLPSINARDFILALDKINKKTKKPIFFLSIGGLNTQTYIKKLEEKNIFCLKDPKHIGNIFKYL